MVIAELVENPSDVKHAAWRTVFTKLRLWQMPYPSALRVKIGWISCVGTCVDERYEKIVYMDADQLVLQSITELFDYPELSASPDCCPPSVFNSTAACHRFWAGPLHALDTDVSCVFIFHLSSFFSQYVPFTPA